MRRRRQRNRCKLNEIRLKKHKCLTKSKTKNKQRAIRKKLEMKEQMSQRTLSTHDTAKLKRKVGYDFDDQPELEMTGKRFNQMELFDTLDT